jgi:putative ABC transport system permease protein
VLVIGAAALERVPRAGGFFGGGSLLLVAALLGLASALQSDPAHPIVPRGRWSLARLGFRAATARPGRTVLSAALIAVATFTIVSVGAFRRDGVAGEDPRAGTGGFTLVAETSVPLVHDPGTPDGRDELGLAPDSLAGLHITRFRLKPGDDGSCLNLYRPENPRLLGAPAGFIDEARFSFSSSIAETDDERRNPWTLLHRAFDDGAVPAIADATSLRYVLHVGVGEDLVVPGPGDRPLTLRIVAALRDSVLQSELLVSEEQFVRAFPHLDGYRVFLIGAPPGAGGDAAAAIERELDDFGVHVEEAAARLAAFHRVENTYLSTFQTLGGLGLVLGTLGVGAVLLRNVLERQRELAVLSAVGFRGAHVSVMIVAETALLVGSGVAIGAGCALLAVSPALAERGTPVPAGTLVLLVSGVALAGLVSSLGAAAMAQRVSVVETLRSE